MASTKNRPAYVHHRPTGQARVRIAGKDFYLGKFGTPESRKKYEELVTAWLSDQDPRHVALTIDDLALLFLDFAKTYYRHRDGTETRSTNHFCQALRPVIQLYGQTLVRDFGPRSLKRVRETMIEAGHCRNYINCLVGKIKRVFRWGVEEELVPPGVYQALAAVSGLREGRTAARESDPVRPVPESIVERTLPAFTSVVADMVRLQLLTGMRPGEVCQLRPGDVSRRDNEAWIYIPRHHKTEHHGRQRKIFIGPEGQKILAPYLLRAADAYCFSPRESEQERSRTRRESRQSPMTPSQAQRQDQRALCEFYTKDTYNRAIQRGCETAFEMPDELRYIDRFLRRDKTLTPTQFAKLKQERQLEAAAWRKEHCWSPNQLRHTRATTIRERFGLEAAQIVLGHADPKVTEIYAERDFTKAAEIMRLIG